MKCFALVTAGLGNIVETTPMLAALETISDNLDVGIQGNWPGIEKLLPWNYVSEYRSDKYDVLVGSWWARQNPFLRMEKQKGKKVLLPRLNVIEFSEIDCNLDIARQLGYSGEIPATRLQIVGESPIKEKYIVLAPGFQKSTNYVNWNCKSWPHWKELAEMLKDCGHKLAFVGTANECEEWHKDVVDYDLCGKTDLITLAATMRCASGVIGVDNGPCHVADAYGVPVVALFGPGSTIKNAYNTAKVMFAPTDAVPCRPCQFDMARMSNCKDNKCMQLIKPKQVRDVFLNEIKNKIV